MPRKYELLACPDCGKIRKVNIIKKKPVSLRCRICHAKRVAEESKNHPEWRPGNPNWKKKEREDLIEYKRVKINSDSIFYPMVDNRGLVREHRLIMAQVLGRPLEKWEIVHHKNGNKMDNRRNNLEINTKEGHSRITAMQLKIDQLQKEIRRLKGLIE